MAGKRTRLGLGGYPVAAVVPAAAIISATLNVTEADDTLIASAEVTGSITPVPVQPSGRPGVSGGFSSNLLRFDEPEEKYLPEIKTVLYKREQDDKLIASVAVAGQILEAPKKRKAKKVEVKAKAFVEAKSKKQPASLPVQLWKGELNLRVTEADDTLSAWTITENQVRVRLRDDHDVLIARVKFDVEARSIIQEQSDTLIARQNCDPSVQELLLMLLAA